MAWANVPRTWPEIRRRADPLLIHPSHVHPSHGLCQVGMFKAGRLWFIVCGRLTPQSGPGGRVRAG
jgi:hypothetical protein